MAPVDHIIIDLFEEHAPYSPIPFHLMYAWNIFKTTPPPPPYIERIYLFYLSITLTWPINLPFKQFQQKNTFTYRVEWPLSNFVRIEKVYKMFDVLMKTRKIPDQKQTFNGKNGTKNTQLKNENVNKCSGKSHKPTIKNFVAGSKMSFTTRKKHETDQKKFGRSMNWSLLVFEWARASNLSMG